MSTRKAKTQGKYKDPSRHSYDTSSYVVMDMNVRREASTGRLVGKDTAKDNKKGD